MEMDLVLNNLQRLICHKTQTNKQTNKFISRSTLYGYELIYHPPYWPGQYNTRTALLQRGKTTNSNDCPWCDTEVDLGECGVPVHCYYSKVQSESNW